MEKIGLIIADSDTSYVQNLVRYILLKYSQRFAVYTFTSPEFLDNHLVSSGDKTDLLLLGKNFITARVGEIPQGIVILLSEEEACKECSDTRYLYKYQHAERLVTELIAIYSGSCGRCSMPEGKGNSVIIAAASAAGGCGKTAIAVCGSVLCARKAAKVLYINLESVSSTSVYFKGGSERSLTNVIFYLKENSPNLAMKIEGARCLDPVTGVYFFRPAVSLQDVEEMSFKDTELLFDTLRRSGGYDVIFADLSCGLSARNIAALKACDSVLLISSDRRDTESGSPLLEAEYSVLLERYGLDIEKKSIPVLNMSRNTAHNGDGNTIGFYPDMEQYFTSAYTGCRGFCNEVGRLTEKVIGHCGRLGKAFQAMQHNRMGGDNLVL